MRSWATYWGVDCVILSLYYQIRFSALIIAIYITVHTFIRLLIQRFPGSFFFFCTTIQLSKATIWFAQLGSHAKSNIHIQINRWNEGFFLRLRDGHLHPLRIWAGITHFFLGQLLYTAHICSPVLAKAFRSGRLVFITCDVFLFLRVSETSSLKPRGSHEVSRK